MAMPTNLLFLRHGESEGNVASEKAKLGDHSSYTDEFVTTPGRHWALTDEGIRQAQLIGDWLQTELEHLATMDARRNYVSPYLRTNQTAGHLGLTRPDGESIQWYVNRGIRERDWGDIDSIPKAEFRADPIYKLNAAKQKQDPLYWRPPGGESIQDVADNRVRNFLSTLHRECSDKTVLAVTHGEFIKAARLTLERISDKQFMDEKESDFSHVRNCEVLQYTKLDMGNPANPATFNRLSFVRSVYPLIEKNEVVVGDWRPVNYRLLTNEELLRGGI